MLLLECPYCGPRDESEFRCGGQSHIVRPRASDGPSDEAWGEYLYVRDNPKGLQLERWHHVFGCRQWFNVARDTVTHEVKAIYRMGEPRPEGLE